MNTKILVTGGNGFIGHHFCEHILKTTNWDIDIMDRMSYASMGYDRLRDVKVYDDRRVRHFCHDFTKPITEGLKSELGCPMYIVHLGAETHVDNSIDNPEAFVMSNVIGTMHMLNFAKDCYGLDKFIYFSTDEVFGPASMEEVPKGFKEWDRYKSSNPYAAAKAGGEELAIAYHNTYKLPVLVTHTMNVFGERQHPEKFIPMTIRKILKEEEVIIHADQSCTIPGSRFYIHARNVASAISFLLDIGEPGDKYNIVGDKEVNNLELAQQIASVLQRPLKSKLVDFHSSRPGHDLRYALNGDKLVEMGFKYPKDFEESLEKTVLWSIANYKWLGLEEKSND